MDLCDVPDLSSCEGEALHLPEGVPPLRSFYLYLSTGCNLRCRHCWIDPTFVDGKPSPGEVIDIDLLRQAVVEAKPLGLCAAKLTGGEPMLHPRFMEVVDMLTSQGLALDMETNGTLLTAESARHLKEETNVNFVSVSIDGSNPKTHDSFRGVPGAFDSALKGLAHLVEAGYDNVQVIMSLHRMNTDQIDDLVNLSAKLGAGSVKLNPVTKGGRGTEIHKRGEALNFNEIMHIADHVYGDLQKRSPIRIVLKLSPALTPIPEMMRGGGCPGDCNVRHILGILGTGEIALCGIGRTFPELVYGFLGRDSIREIWLHHPEILRLRWGFDDIDSFPEMCKKCVHIRTCRTGCVAQNYVEYGKHLYPEMVCIEAENLGIFPITRKK